MFCDMFHLLSIKRMKGSTQNKSRPFKIIVCLTTQKYKPFFGTSNAENMCYKNNRFHFDLSSTQMTLFFEQYFHQLYLL